MEEKIEKIAQVCHEANKAYCETLGDGSQVHWDMAPIWQRDSARAGVRFRMDNPNCDAAEMHGNWLRHKQADGWTYGPVKDEDERTHPCVLPYDMLPPEQKKKDALFSAIVTALA